VPRSRLERTCALIGVIIAALLASLVVATWRGYERHSQNASPGIVLDDTAEAASLRERPTVATTTSPAQDNAVVAVTAVEGDCWLEVRVGSGDGRELYFGMLQRGATTRFEGRRLWLRLGAAQSVEIRLDGDPVDGVGTGVRALFASADGVVPAPAS
jgi:hypothetical protein